jgi:hypothetical protein
MRLIAKSLKNQRIIKSGEHSRYKEPLQLKTARDVYHDGKSNNAVLGYLHKLRQANPAGQRIHEIPLPQLRRNSDQTRRKMPQVRTLIQVPQMRFRRTMKGERAWVALL